MGMAFLFSMTRVNYRFKQNYSRIINNFFLKGLNKLGRFYAISTRETTFVAFCLLSSTPTTFCKGIYSKSGQILSFYRRPIFRNSIIYPRVSGALGGPPGQLRHASLSHCPKKSKKFRTKWPKPLSLL